MTPRAIFSSLLLLSLLLAATAVHAHAGHNSDEHEHERHEPDPSLRHCKYTRKGAVDCAQKYADLNGDGLICGAEIDALKAAVLYWPERLYAALHSASNTMEHCDYDRDGYISERDFYDSERTCLHDCEALTEFNGYICERAERLHLRLPEVACE